MGDLLAVYGPDIRLARSRVALVLAMCAAARGRSVVAAESAGGNELGFALAVPGRLLAGGGLFPVPGVPDGRFALAVRQPGGKESPEDLLAGAAAGADLLVMSCGEGAVLPGKPSGEVLVTAYEGELLRRSAAMRPRYRNAGLVAALAYPCGRSQQYIASRAAKVFPDLGRGALNMPLYLFKPLDIPAAGDMDGELWRSAAGILEAVLNTHMRAQSATATDSPPAVVSRPVTQIESAADGQEKFGDPPAPPESEEVVPAAELSGADNGGVAPQPEIAGPADVAVQVVAGGRNGPPDKEVSVGIRIARPAAPTVIEAGVVHKKRHEGKRDSPQAARVQHDMHDLPPGPDPSGAHGKQDAGGGLNSARVKDSVGRTHEAFGKLVKR